MQYLSADALARMLDMTTEHVRDKLSKTHRFPPACVIGAYCAGLLHARHAATTVQKNSVALPAM